MKECKLTLHFWCYDLLKFSLERSKNKDTNMGIKSIMITVRILSLFMAAYLTVFSVESLKGLEVF